MKFKLVETTILTISVFNPKYIYMSLYQLAWSTRTVIFCTSTNLKLYTCLLFLEIKSQGINNNKGHGIYLSTLSFLISKF